jgi:integrase
VLALSTGARKNELVSLTLSQLDLQRGVIYLNETKNGERRTLHITGYALNLLKRHIQKRRTNTDLLFPKRDGRKPIRIREAWDNAVKRAGIEDFTFHDLRHCAASYLAMNGASLAEIAEILGHKSLEMAKRYTHLSEHHTSTVLERMNEAIFGKSS